VDLEEFLYEVGRFASGDDFLEIQLNQTSNDLTMESQAKGVKY